MRDISFRAWDEGKKKMADVQQLQFFLGDVDSIMAKPIGWSKESTGAKGRPILMQYTGLKDKNGKPIFEGDIVKYYDSTTMWLNAEVIFSDGSFAVKHPDPKMEQDIELRQFTYQDMKGIEVIGNIYENPELLKIGGAL